MDQESISGRRRSSRLAARGVTTPRTEVTVKKTVKSSEKPKRSKRKTTEEVIELPEAKKTKTENKTSSDEIDNVETNNANDVEKNEVSAMDVDNNETNVLPSSNVEENDKPTIEDKTDVPTQDSKEQEIVENIPVAKEDKEKVDASLSTDDKKPEAAEDSAKIKDPETTEPPKNDVSQEETKPEPVVSENSNGTIGEKETVEPVEVTKIDTGFRVATKDTLTSNGNANDKVKPEIKSTNGDQSIQKLEANDAVKALREDKNHTIETEIKAVTTPTIIITTTNNDASSVEQVEKELDKTVENVDNKSISVDDNAPNVDQSSTIVS